MCDGTEQRLVKTLRSTTSAPFNPALRTGAGVRFRIRSDSDPWQGDLHATDSTQFENVATRVHYDVQFRRVWVNDLGRVKTRLTYVCPTGVVYDRDDIDTVWIAWSQTHDETANPPAYGASNSDNLEDVVCDDTVHTIVKSSSHTDFLPGLPIVVEWEAKGFVRVRTVLPE
jgi:hypothetical protein